MHGSVHVCTQWPRQEHGPHDFSLFLNFVCIYVCMCGDVCMCVCLQQSLHSLVIYSLCVRTYLIVFTVSEYVGGSVVKRSIWLPVLNMLVRSRIRGRLQDDEEGPIERLCYTLGVEDITLLSGEEVSSGCVLHPLFMGRPPACTRAATHTHTHSNHEADNMSRAHESTHTHTTHAHLLKLFNTLKPRS